MKSVVHIITMLSLGREYMWRSEHHLCDSAGSTLQDYQPACTLRKGPHLSTENWRLLVRINSLHHQQARCLHAEQRAQTFSVD